MYRLHYAPDNASLIVRLVLEELGCAYETVLVDRRAREQKSSAYLKLNPMGLIPVLETPESPIFETGAILLYLSERHAALAPAPGSRERGAFLAWLFATSNGLHADMRELFHPELTDGTQEGSRAIRGRIATHLDRLEALSARPQGWFASAQPSLLDFYVATLLRWLALYPEGGAGWFELSRWPGLATMARRIEARPSMERAQAAEGLGPTPLSAPRHAYPPEGHAT